jgi:hypothetical protein
MSLLTELELFQTLTCYRDDAPTVLAGLRIRLEILTVA